MATTSKMLPLSSDCGSSTVYISSLLAAVVSYLPLRQNVKARHHEILKHDFLHKP